MQFSGMKVPYFTIPAPDCFDAVMAADSDVFASHPGITVFYRKLFAADELHAPDVEEYNAVRVVYLGPGLRARQIAWLGGIDLEQDGVMYEEDHRKEDGTHKAKQSF